MVIHYVKIYMCAIYCTLTISKVTKKETKYLKWVVNFTENSFGILLGISLNVLVNLKCLNIINDINFLSPNPLHVSSFLLQCLLEFLQFPNEIIAHIC